MDFDYFYVRDSESFRFIRLPIVFIQDEKFKGLSIDAKVLYSKCLSRNTLSYKNNWIDENDNVDPYKLTFVYKTGFKDNLDGSKFKSPRKMKVRNIKRM